MPNKSDSIAALAKALAAAQGEIKGAVRDSENPYFKSTYADLTSVWDACRGPLSKNGLSIIQLPQESVEFVVLETILLHASGEWISGILKMKPLKNDPQSIGSCLTYARRYGLSAIVGIAPEDDDGNAASGSKGQNGHKTRPEDAPQSTISPPHMSEHGGEKVLEEYVQNFKLSDDGKRYSTTVDGIMYSYWDKDGFKIFTKSPPDQLLCCKWKKETEKNGRKYRTLVSVTAIEEPGSED